ncbi:hypothetical protein D9758_018051 [Tetrapyrgos nigripes]|uniref:Uncharacterized protein n=1 Tax=Tetrapyrgos nigripes TaxID=182062 RepID=A0A8H5F8R2_9AGAR|nr:hypothetical protein D9758_018051 [Tetrapyrgos nigripes]
MTGLQGLVPDASRTLALEQVSIATVSFFLFPLLYTTYITTTLRIVTELPPSLPPTSSNMSHHESSRHGFRSVLRILYLVMALALLVDAAPATNGTGKTAPATGGSKGTGTGGNTDKSGGSKGPAAGTAPARGPRPIQDFLGYRTATAAEAADFDQNNFKNFKSKVDGKANLGLAMYVVDNPNLLQVGKSDKLCYVYARDKFVMRDEQVGNVKAQYTKPNYNGKPVIADYDPKTASTLEKNRLQAIEETYRRAHPNVHMTVPMGKGETVYSFFRISQRTSGSVKGNQLAIPWSSAEGQTSVYCYDGPKDPNAPKVSKLDYAELIQKKIWKGTLVITDPPSK